VSEQTWPSSFFATSCNAYRCRARERTSGQNMTVPGAREEGIVDRSLSREPCHTKTGS
jgi:hypothetical protein